MTDNNYIGNISTIIKIISMTLAGWIITNLTTQGYNIGIDAITLASFIGAIIGLLLSIIDAKYPNTIKIFNNKENPVTIENDEVLNDEYVTGDAEDGC